jgi:hypothetical protein
MTSLKLLIVLSDFVENPTVGVVCSFIPADMEIVHAQTFTGAEQPR